MLRHLLGPKFDAAMQQLPATGRRRDDARRQADPGTRWMAGGCMTAMLTLRYRVDAVGGGIDAVTCTWGSVHGMLPDGLAAYDIFLRCTGLVDDVE